MIMKTEAPLITVFSFCKTVQEKERYTLKDLFWLIVDQGHV